MSIPDHLESAYNKHYDPVDLYCECEHCGSEKIYYDDELELTICKDCGHESRD